MENLDEDNKKENNLKNDLLMSDFPKDALISLATKAVFSFWRMKSLGSSQHVLIFWYILNYVITWRKIGTSICTEVHSDW